MNRSSSIFEPSAGDMKFSFLFLAIAMLGPEYEPPTFPIAHASILAYAAAMKGDPKLAAQVGEGLFSTGKNEEPSLETRRIEGPEAISAY
ncbi:MAG TPA: hypothetical protein EYQ31_02095 [Candidatus Handelsmanbacteria bacterium]|nr:hypothetical protein [Candidatus Handelsmanbacteria bacterium]